ncbi:hypothetical protein GUITHDRAFT_146465 [Guillardia theta CCMP2712]|uniref:Phospholipid-transporting ATPase n=1 Tax=Guillardia theta (strain CCMP2712) TaxID=905079 RepID=L1IGT5_GUITC|nr:hypothetical protein GUITHDRAFT_146465 [Guillardia theta CCMP2712]EKX35443.1 hypothetical protein GUITHDRAFT_146465 [Guillardia theta CCMP2712]|eukprot:XP_005822423.1 hypothetical protein GUITHDRAFT_146465 [Guillardia theta CCMP2712]
MDGPDVGGDQAFLYMHTKRDRKTRRPVFGTDRTRSEHKVSSRGKDLSRLVLSVSESRKRARFQPALLSHQHLIDFSPTQNWSRCWSCDLPVRADWKVCPSLECRADLTRELSERGREGKAASTAAAQSSARHRSEELSDEEVEFEMMKEGESDEGESGKGQQEREDDQESFSDLELDETKYRKLSQPRAQNGLSSHSMSEGEPWCLRINDEEWNLEYRKQHAKVGKKIFNNMVATSKYNLYNFLPVNLYEQFSRLANIYFLIISILQLFTSLSPTSRYSTAGPLLLVVSANMIREVWEDSARHRDDREVNNRYAHVLPADEEEELCAWKELVVGTMVKVGKDEPLPADVVVLCSSEEGGACYIDTCDLDGETNLKLKSSVAFPPGQAGESAVRKMKAELEYEAPNKRLYTFLGKLRMGKEEIAVDNESVLLRGAVLRNTKWVIGVVVYAGRQTKIMMNNKKGKLKRSNVEHSTNRILAGILLFELAMCCIGTIGHAIWASGKNSATWYMPYLENESNGEKAAIWLSYFILLNNYVPISLYITMELVKLGQKFLMDNDLDMYHEATDTPMTSRTSNLNEELGQIQQIFTDKTGTLTRNEMEFRKCYIGSSSYGFGTTEIGLAAAAKQKEGGEGGGGGGGRGERREGGEGEEEKYADRRRAQIFPDAKCSFDDYRIVERMAEGHREAAEIRDFLLLLSVCHTVVPEGNGDGARGERAGEEERFQILNVNKFNSARKRMSVVCRTGSGELLLLCKGADNVMLERLKMEEEERKRVERVLHGYAMEGLRTLVLGKRRLSEEQWSKWNEAYKAASTSLVDREEEMMRAAEMIEQGMRLVGVTAIEDKLQEGVPATIKKLRKARMRMWMLTGDKMETAENIGFACNLLHDNMNIERISVDSLARAKEEVKRLSQAWGGREDKGGKERALVVDGASLLHIFAAADEDGGGGGGGGGSEEAALLREFVEVARGCKAVIACRVSPDQKRQVVTVMRREEGGPLSLAIGDGANDVPMIMEAHVGVGISGNEGMQAVRSSDYAIAQFRFLEKLLLVHGRSNYKRIAVVIAYSLYKNCFFVTSLFFFSFYSGFTAAALYDSLMIAGFNIFWSSMGIIAYGVLEQDVSSSSSLLYPQLYSSGQQRLDFNGRVLTEWILHAILHAVICFFVIARTFLGSIVEEEGREMGLGPQGTAILQALVIAVNLKLLIITKHLTLWSCLFYSIGIVLFILGGSVHR